ncbi:MAG: hypothetical protein KC425_23210, partial [Anaerolineales bacterium]|nr:hypothetical protein [Anaerolineales bacterium]
MHRSAFRLLLLLCCFLPACDFGRTANPTPAATATLPPAAANPTAAAATAAIPAPILPTAAATAVPAATRPYDPALPDWTLLVYMAADNSLELAALRDLNEMEAAAGSERVTVVVQVDRAAGETAVDDDWTTARRLRITPDDDPTTVTSPTLADLGEINMGAPAALHDFIAWGVQTFPANRTALVLWDHGAGWQGLAFDDDDAAAAADHLTLPELTTAVSASLAQSGLPMLDVVAFDACLMSQLDVLQAIQPHARFAVASAELTPGQGWDYQALLTSLAADPQQDGARLAWELVNTFANFYTQVEPDDFVTMTAVDLRQLPPLAHAVEQLAATLLADPAFAAAAVGDARSGAEQFARAYGAAAAQVAAVDLGHFAAILAQRSPDPLVQETAVALQTAIDQAVVAHTAGSGFRHSRGIAAYFPQQQADYAPEYGRVTRLTTWHRFLNSYYDVGLAGLTPPEVNLVGSLRDVVGVQAPAYLDFELVGRQIAAVQLVGGRYEADGRRRLLEFDTLIPEPTTLPDGSRLTAWRDGLHEDFFVWDTLVTYLYDRTGSGGFVVMCPTDATATLISALSTLGPLPVAPAYPASLVFDYH